MGSSNHNFNGGEMRLLLPAFICIVGLLLFLGSRFTPQAVGNPASVAPKSASWHGMPNYIDDPEAGSAMMRKLAARTGGDYFKLTPDEQRFVDSVSGGNGPAALQAMAQYQRRKPKKPAKASPAH